MPTQLEVYQAIKEMGGYCTVKDLKEYYNLPYNGGSSFIPMRLKALTKKQLITPLRVEPMFTVYFVLDPDDLPDPGPEDFNPPKPIRFNQKSIQKLLTLLSDNPPMTKADVRKELRWTKEIADKYINKLLDDYKIMRLELYNKEVYTTPQKLEEQINEFYQSIYS